ncbi:MAG: DnaJ domain-containing protein, partial [Actinomycetota bacterium]|nr:DnaJ domain-containing protein [Actinomycetota bacterium]
MTEQDWVKKDFYAELGVSSTASADEIKKSYRKLARGLHPDKNPGDAKAEARFKSVGEAYHVLSNAETRRKYDETRALFGSGARAGGGFNGGFGTGAGGFGGGYGSSADINLEDLLGRAAAGRGGQAGGLGDLFGGIFGGGASTGRGTRTSTQSRRGADVESEIRLPFADAVHGAT